jgi:ABC-type glycerol-3-phosphate transport system substrate-binding protein
MQQRAISEGRSREMNVVRSASIAVTLLLLLSVVATSAIGASIPRTTTHATTADQEAPINLVVVGYQLPPDLLEPQLQQFQSQNPNITVEFLRLGDSEAYIPGLQMLINAGTPIDVLLVNGDSFTAALGSDLLLDVTDTVSYFDRFNEALFYDEFFEVDGRRYGVPSGIGYFSTLMYNQPLLSELGLEFPQTFDELTAAAPVFRDAGIAPVAGFGKEWNFYAVMTLHMTLDQMAGNNQVEILRDTLSGEMAFTDQVYQDAWACAKRYFDEELFQVEPGPNGAAWLGLDEATAGAILPARKVGMAWNGNWSFPSLKEAAAESGGTFELGLGLPPLCPDAPSGAVSRAVAYPGNLWSVYKTATHPEQAMVFLDFISSDESAQAWMSYYETNLTSNVNATPPEGDEIDAAGRALFDDGVIDATWMLGIDLSQYYAEQFERVVKGEQSISDGLAAVEAWKLENADKVPG